MNPAPIPLPIEPTPMFPMNRLTDVLIRFVELLEAEGRVAKVNALRVTQSVAMILVAAGSAVAGLIVLGVAFYQALRMAHLPPPVASLIVGLCFLLVTGVLTYTAGLHLRDIKTRKDLDR